MKPEGRILAGMIAVCFGAGTMMVQPKDKVIVKLPVPTYESRTSIEQAIRQRRSIRDFAWTPLTLREIGQLVWAAQGITQWSGRLRTAPSAGALYPLELYVVVGNAEELERGVYRYIPLDHELVKIDDRDLRVDLSRAALEQESIRDAPVVLVFSGIVDRTKSKYGGRAMRYIFMEAGHAAQNVFLQSVSLGIGTVVVGAFNDEEVSKVMNLSEAEHPLYIMPVGKPGSGNP